MSDRKKAHLIQERRYLAHDETAKALDSALTYSLSRKQESKGTPKLCTSSTWRSDI